MQIILLSFHASNLQEAEMQSLSLQLPSIKSLRLSLISGAFNSTKVMEVVRVGGQGISP